MAPPSAVDGVRADQIYRLSNTITGTTASDDGSGDEGTTVVDSPSAAKQSTQSSPTIKKEKS